MPTIKPDDLSIERAQLWLGTLVRIRVGGLPPQQAHAGIDAAFQEIATVHRLMSFHMSDSDLSRLNQAAANRAVRVHHYTFEALRYAQQLSHESDGCFDVTVGRELVQVGLLPKRFRSEESAGGTWEDIQLLGRQRVRFRKPLCLDLGGIAKGYAVDRATEALLAFGAEHVVVNAGGDLRVHGQMERILLQPDRLDEQASVLELCDGSAASSSGYRSRLLYQGVWYGPHLHGRKRTPLPTERFACVAAPACVMADGLTKVLLTGAGSAQLLRRFGAVGYLHDPATGWTRIAEEPVV